MGRGLALVRRPRKPRTRDRRLALVRRPRKQGCTDLTPVERGVIAALTKLKFKLTSAQIKSGTFALSNVQIAAAIGRNRWTVQQCAAGRTHKPRAGQRGGRGTPLSSSTADDERSYAVLQTLKKKNRGKRVTTAPDVRRASAFPASESTMRRRWRKRPEPTVARSLLRQIPSQTGDAAARLAFAQTHRDKPESWWVEGPPAGGPVHADCKKFRAYLNAKQRARLAHGHGGASPHFQTANC